MKYKPIEAWEILCDQVKKFAEENHCKFIQNRPKPGQHRYKARKRKKKASK